MEKQTNVYHVRIPRQRKPLTVYADYVKLEAGHLVFRNQFPNCYPETVQIFAPTGWLQCTNAGKRGYK